MTTIEQCLFGLLVFQQVMHMSQVQTLINKLDPQRYKEFQLAGSAVKTKDQEHKERLIKLNLNQEPEDSLARTF